ncbi:MAG: hypothetical protein KDB00_13095 [Planctomycetales bacterium]|nr:hypothetical protein [Planctomycetales bacterium]
MTETVVQIVIATSAIGTYIFELWTGLAVAGWQGENAIIDRRSKPGPYWFVIAVQTMVLIIVPVLIALYR